MCNKMKLIVVFSVLCFVATFVDSQWVGGCGRSVYPDAGELQSWNVDDISVNVIAGVEGRPNEFPWLVMIQNLGALHCGGAILNNDYILTTATCVRDVNMGDLRVITDRHSTTSGGSFYTVSDIIPHANYNDVSREWDIALLRTTTPMFLSENVTGVCPPEVADHSNYQVTVSGWGHYSPQGEQPEVMQYASLYGLSDAQCDGAFPGMVENMMCADHSTYFRSACAGDLGGPLVFNNGGTFQLVGLVAWAEGCDNTDPGRFTEIYNFLSWIADNAI